MYIAHLHRWAIMTLDVACWRRPVPYHLDEDGQAWIAV